MCLMLGWAIPNPFILVKNRNLKNNKRETALNDTQMYLLTVQPEGPRPQTRNKIGSEAAAKPATRSEKPRPCLAGGRYCRPASQLRWSDTRLWVQSKFSHQFPGICK